MSEPLSVKDKLAIVAASLGIMAIIAGCGWILAVAIVFRAVPTTVAMIVFVVLLGGFIALCRVLA